MKSAKTHVGQNIAMYTVINPGPIYKDSKRYVEVECKCGLRKQVREIDLIQGNSTGCYRCAGKAGRLAMILPDNASVWNHYYNNYRQNAIARNIEFIITIETFKTITQQNCVYCGKSPAMIKTYRNRSIVVNGVDRKNNKTGYSDDNCSSCCKRCNRAKWDMTEQEFLSHVQEIYEHRFGIKR